jgi:hypothetical protein
VTTLNDLGYRCASLGERRDNTPGVEVAADNADSRERSADLFGIIVEKAHDNSIETRSGAQFPGQHHSPNPAP